MTDPWIAFQRDVLAAGQQNLELARRALDAGGTPRAAQRTVKAVSDANLKAWKSWLDLWSPRP